MEVLNEKVKYLRLQRNWTQQHLADACDLSLRTVQRIEKYGNASHESIMSLCVAFAISKDDICAIPKPNQADLQEVTMVRPLLYILPSLLVGIALGVSLAYWLLQ